MHTSCIVIHMKYFIFIFTFFTISCGGGSNEYKYIDDLPFNDAQDAKEYADIVLKSIRTNRDFPIWQEFADRSLFTADTLKMWVSMYSTGIGGRDDWQFIDVYADSESKDMSNGFNYAWLDPSDRLAMQIKIIPKGTADGFDLEKIEFRSRLDVVHSRAFPGGVINDYEKLDYDWEAKMKRISEEVRK